MIEIPWTELNLYQFHSNPEQLDGYSDDLHYLPTATQIYDTYKFYEEWYYNNEENDGWDDDYPKQWSLDFLIRQADDARWRYEEDKYDDDEVEPTLDKLSEVQLEWLHDFITVRYDDLNIDYTDRKGMVDAFAKFYKNDSE